MSAPPRLLYVVTHPMSARHLLNGQLRWMTSRGFEVALAVAPGENLDEIARQEGVRVFEVPMKREIAPANDLAALWRLRGIMRSWNPDLVNAGTPKAGLLGMSAARTTNVSARLYVLRGLRLETTTGPKRALLHLAERVASAAAHEVVAVSHSLADRYIELGLAPAQKVRVLGSGASNGVDVDRFSNPDESVLDRRRKELGLSSGTPVIGFVGRLTRDKGIEELIEAYRRVRRDVPEIRLLMLGGFEEGDPVSEETSRTIQNDPKILWPGFVPDTAPYYSLMSVLAFPSHREGFPNAPIEAAAAGVPTVGFRATGTVDAIQDGVTGRIVPLGDVARMARELTAYLRNVALRQRHGRAARERAETEFSRERVWELLLEEYEKLLARAGSRETRN